MQISEQPLSFFLTLMQDFDEMCLLAGFDDLMYAGAAVGAINRGRSELDGPKVERKK